MNPLQRIRQNKKGRSLTPDDLPLIHDILMKEYGYIPLKDFMEMPMSTMWNLLDCIKDRKEKEQQEYENRNKKRKR